MNESLSLCVKANTYKHAFPQPSDKRLYLCHNVTVYPVMCGKQVCELRAQLCVCAAKQVILQDSNSKQK